MFDVEVGVVRDVRNLRGISVWIGWLCKPRQPSLSKKRELWVYRSCSVVLLISNLEINSVIP